MNRLRRLFLVLAGVDPDGLSILDATVQDRFCPPAAGAPWDRFGGGF